jgi:Spy/CpxP family protein refolding chaperone
MARVIKQFLIFLTGVLMTIISKGYKLSISTCVMALVCAVSAAAIAGEGGPPPMQFSGPPEAGGERFSPMLRGIALSEAQRDKLFELAYAQMPVVRKKMKALGASEAELHELLTSPNYSEAKVKVLVDTISRMQADLMLLRIKADREAFEMLTPQQRQQFVERPVPPRPHSLGQDARQPPKD